MTNYTAFLIGGLAGSLLISWLLIWLFSFLLRKIFKNKIPHVLLYPIAAVIFLGLMSVYIYFLNFVSIPSYLIASIIICIIEFITFKIKNRKTTKEV
jgi:ABC-type bacteriocin/lantibiotic exporter with double-glycine peptidase domain